MMWMPMMLMYVSENDDALAFKARHWQVCEISELTVDVVHATRVKRRDVVDDDHHGGGDDDDGDDDGDWGGDDDDAGGSDFVVR